MEDENGTTWSESQKQLTTQTCTKTQPLFHSAMTVWHKDSAVRNCVLSGHCCFLSFSTRLGADMNRPPHENGFQLKSMGCTRTREKDGTPNVTVQWHYTVLHLWLMWMESNDNGSRKEAWKDIPWREIREYFWIKLETCMEEVMKDQKNCSKMQIWE